MPDESLVDCLAKIGADDGSPAGWERFRHSELFTDLTAGRRRVQVECTVIEGDWSQTETRILPPAFWQHAYYGFRNHPDTGFYIQYALGLGKSKMYVRPIVLGAENASVGGEPETHSGMPGRPTAQHLYKAEHARRHAAGEMLPAVGEEAQVLLTWLKTQHPTLNPGTRGTIENNIRHRHRALKASTK